MPFAIGQDIEVKADVLGGAPQGADPGETLVLREATQEVAVYLPATELPSDPKLRLDFLRAVRNGQLVTVRVIEHDEASGHCVVSRRQVLQGDPWRDQVPGWVEAKTVKRMRVRNV